MFHQPEILKLAMHFRGTAHSWRNTFLIAILNKKRAAKGELLTMDMTLNSLTNTFGTLPSLPNTGTITVAPTADTGLVQSAVDLSSEAGVIAQLGVPGVNLQTYNATGLLNQLVQSGTAPAALPIPVSGADTQEISQQLTDNAVVNTLASNPVDSGIYTSSGGFQNTGLDSNWASILKSNPSLAATVAGDTFTQGIVGTLFNVTA